MGRHETSEKSSLNRLVELAENGDSKALADLKALDAQSLKEYALQAHGNLAAITENALIKTIVGDNLMLHEGLCEKVKVLKKDLSGPKPSPLEHMLIERILCCWLMAHYSDVIYAQNMADRTWVVDEFVQKRQDRAQRRFLQACKALAEVRKLLGPNIQLNVAEKQVNVTKFCGS